MDHDMKKINKFTFKNILIGLPLMAFIPMVFAEELADEIITPSAVNTNVYGLENIWSQGDFVTNLTISILLIMSISSWYISATKLKEQIDIMKGLKNISPDFWKELSNNQVITSFNSGEAFKNIASEALATKGEYVGPLTKNIPFNMWIEIGVTLPFEEFQEKLGSGMNFLATIGSTAPFVGLFGTVWGIYHALTAIGASGETSIDKIAGPIGEALIMTALGLAVAVPAVFFYNWLQKRNKNIIDSLHRFSSKVEKVLLSSPVN